MKKREELYTIKPIAYVQSDYNQKFGIPRQCGLVSDLEQAIVFEPEFSNPDAVKGLEGFSYIWLIWGFSENAIDMTAKPIKWFPMVRPPRLGGNRKKGVFASRSPYRPNSMGLSSVQLQRIIYGDEVIHGITEDVKETLHSNNVKNSLHQNDRLIIIVKGADLLNGTPIYDIKPYIPYSDSHPEARAGFTEQSKDVFLNVEFPEELLERIDENKRAGLCKVLELDPRGAYEKQDGHVYGLSFADWDVRFSVESDVLTVVDVVSVDSEQIK